MPNLIFFLKSRQDVPFVVLGHIIDPYTHWVLEVLRELVGDLLFGDCTDSDLEFCMKTTRVA